MKEDEVGDPYERSAEFIDIMIRTAGGSSLPR
jgi:hypothetical protein